MGTPLLRRELAEEAIARVEAELRAGKVPQWYGGGKSAVEAAKDRAVKDGWVAATASFYSRLRAAKKNYGLEPDWTLYRPARHQMPTPSIVLRTSGPPPLEIVAPTGDRKRVLVIGDLHQDPRKEHRLKVLTWIARYASEQKFERIIQVGDWSTNDSASTHDKNDTLAGRLKPGFRDDLDNLTASHQAFRKGIADDYRPKLDFLMGNHEHRFERYENAHPEAHQTFTLSRDEIFAQFGWKVRPYGELFYVERVGFTHHAVNGAGKAFGGKTGPQRGANETTVPIVGGHTHRRQVHDAPKIGPLDVVSMVEVGCAMPWADLEHYVETSHQPLGWWWGVCDMTVQDGMITDIGFKSMLEIERRYSDDGGDVRA